MTKRVSIALPSSFGFWQTVYSHGWCALEPFSVDREAGVFHAAFPMNGGGCVVSLRGQKGKLFVDAESSSPIDGAALRRIVRTCFRLDEPIDEFHIETRRYPGYRWISRKGAGRLLRCPTVFEDAVKMLFTTNCSWALTESMTRNLIARLGTRIDKDHRLFPTPDAIADASERFLRREIRCGYRAPFLREFASAVAKGSLSVEEWRTSSATTTELFDEVRSVKGFGAYAAGNLLKLLGRYDYLGLDSWSRASFYALHKKGRRVKDSTIERFYEPYGRWRGLFFWFDVTKKWYSKKFPF